MTKEEKLKTSLYELKVKILTTSPNTTRKELADDVFKIEQLLSTPLESEEKEHKCKFYVNATWTGYSSCECGKRINDSNSQPKDQREEVKCEYCDNEGVMITGLDCTCDNAPKKDCDKCENGLLPNNVICEDCAINGKP